MNRLNMLLEIKSKSLERLGDEKVLDVLSGFPVEATRLIIAKAEEHLGKMRPDFKKEVIEQIERKVNDEYPLENPFFRRYNPIEIYLHTDRDKFASLILQVKENKIIWGFKSGKVDVGYVSTAPINPNNKTFNQVIDQIIERMVEAQKFGERYDSKHEDWEKAWEYNRTLDKKKPKIHEIIKKVAETYNCKVARFDDERKYLQIEIMYEIVKNYDHYNTPEKARKIINDYNRRIIYKFQLEDLKKLTDALVSRLHSYNYFVIRMQGSTNAIEDNGIYIELIFDQTSGKKKLKNGKELKEDDKLNVEHFKKELEKWPAQYDDTKEDIYKKIIRKAFEVEKE